MRLTYAFNHAEAIRAFEEAARIDPDCAICHWGVALAYGPNINWPMDSAAGAAAWTALQRAKELAPKANPREQALIQALGTRYASPPPADRASLDSAYARAMGELATRNPDDHEIATLHAEALMDLRPWAYWKQDGSAEPGTEVILASLEKVIAADSTHPGACHFYIHAVEAVAPAKAVACAERLAALMPGAGHLVHMPAHIYVRVGRYADAIERNEHATHADSVFVATERPSLVYAGLYVPHNWHFLGFAALMAGKETAAANAAKQTVAKTPLAALQALPEYQPMAVFSHLILLKFGRFDEVLAQPMPDAGLAVARAVASYARGTALAATGKSPEAVALVDSVAAGSAGLASPTAKSIVEIAHHSLLAEIAARRKRWSEAEKHYRAAIAIEDGLSYMEPPWWVEPVRHALGAVLLSAGKARLAEQAYREDLTRFPANVWSLVGLSASLKAQGKSDPAVESERDKATVAAGATIAASHY